MVYFLMRDLPAHVVERIRFTPQNLGVKAVFLRLHIFQDFVKLVISPKRKVVSRRGFHQRMSDQKPGYEPVVFF
jgi:hypothetical protein